MTPRDRAAAPYNVPRTLIASHYQEIGNGREIVERWSWEYSVVDLAAERAAVARIVHAALEADRP